MSTGCLVDELAWRTRPVVVRAVGGCEEVVEDLAIDLEGNLLREDRGELHLSVEAVVSVEILCKLWRPTSTELTGLCCDGDRLDLDVNLWDCWRRSGTEIRLKGRHREG